MTNRRQRRATLPRLPQLPGPTRPPELAGLLRIPRARRTQESTRPYPPPPPGYLYSLGEWVVEYHLTRHLGYKQIGPENGDYTTTAVVPGKSYFRQARVRGLGIFVNTDDTRIDFLIPQGAGAHIRAIALDPYSEFTHPDRALDLLKRAVLGREGIDLIWLEDTRLVAGDTQIIDDALRGIDSSQRAHGA